ncbi:ABC transporter substrate-binding protein [Halalkalibacterium halodurans]|uniref:Glycerol-3-phosphate ABC transporter (Glycerol-3-phosphate binding protein) n=1 Tax=Halalkalibacterium halodurans (strain ATCC BAA-125 / DSM 18197 / FERM 7344 / JCM 9153 / C-125) TaxID=272558 RepID=Q9KDY2_HALH5|nr:ABC transporter substrate-binding protein [Halalkalibacterium halodurans]MDY7221612.1 ABC transporter substrate-binding protein [Halalkalibacterium halodurans]MDY7240888.1 ABC transporter substrate-binding protein [Halalkalibacterium halodurans]MED3648264.1 ABC transporter substrate-binding protein [Halalkalibacterium halodurans]MED4174610.1 ABC transporter substrate-binding protein [Halalkalibacterium halodurans]BAB04798.1 glycerol-3-phosphate ABC transporter (glycerol-3-phosphate binding 
MKKFVFMLMVIFCSFWLAACSGGSEQTGSEEESAEADNGSSEEAGEGVANAEKLQVEFWHGMSGGLGETLDELVATYNESQDEVEIVPEYQGSYEELLTKFRSVGGTSDSPGLVQVFEIGTKYMIESGFITPVQEWIDKDNYDVSQLEENILTYYSVDGDLYSMPFNSSTPALYYNKDAFEEVGLDPENPPRSFSEIKEAAEKLTTDDRYGFSILGYGWFFEQLLATQGADYVNNDNGRTDEATEAVFNGEEGLRVFEWIYDMNNDGTFGYFGTNWDDLRAAFQAEQVAMILDSTAGIKGTVEAAPFEVGVGFIPHADDVEPNGVIIGGGSIWMANGISEEEQAAAFDFLKYLQTPEVQAEWHINTGYFAINPAAYEEPIVEQEHENIPQLRVPIEQLQQTVPSTATQGALIPVFPESRQHVVTALENMLQGTDPKTALDQAAEGTNRAIEVYNRTAGE